MKTPLWLFTLSLALIFSGCGKKSDSPGAKAKKTSSTAADGKLEGYWEGVLPIGERELRLGFNIKKNDDGTLSGTLSSPDQGATTAPISSILYNPPSVQIEADGLMASFTGSMNGEGNEITGDFKQGGKTLPLSLKPGKPPVFETLDASAYEFKKDGPPDVRGYWKGTLDVQKMKLRLSMALGKKPDGTYLATLDSLDQGARGIPLTDVGFANNQLHTEWKLGGATYDGELSKDAMELNGQWVQGGTTFPLKWERIDKPFSIASDTSAASFTPPATGKDVRGYWLGSLELGQAALRLGLKVGKNPDGTFVGSMDSLDQGARDLPMTTAVFTNGTAHFTWAGLNASFNGKLDKKGDELVGKYTQGGRAMPMTFKRTATATQ